MIRSYVYGLERVALIDVTNHTYLTDGLGSTAVLAAGNGVPEAAYLYEPFGAPRAPVPSTPTNPMQFAGEFRDPATDLYHLRARDYDSGTGRFTRPDPLPLEAGDPYVSTYSYADNDPLNRVDPTGQRAFVGPQPNPWQVGVGGALSVACRASPVSCAVAGGVAGGVAIDRVNPFRDELVDLGGAAFDFYTRSSGDWYRFSVYRALSSRGTPASAFTYDTDSHPHGVSFFRDESRLSRNKRFKLELVLYAADRNATLAIVELLPNCAAIYSPHQGGIGHWTVRCAGGEQGTKVTLSDYGKAYRDLRVTQNGNYSGG